MRHLGLIPLVLVTLAIGSGPRSIQVPAHEGPAAASLRPGLIGGASAKMTPARAESLVGKLPLSFEINRGQFDSRVRFLARGAGYTLSLTSTEAVLALRRGASPVDRDLRTRSHHPVSPIAGAVIRMRLSGANANPAVTGLEEQAGRRNYYAGSAPHIGAAGVARPRARTEAGLARYENVATYGRVRYEAVYPGVDLVCYGNQRQLEYDLVVAPGADPGVIRLQFDGTDAVEVDRQGELVLKVSGGEVRQHKPVIYQEVAGVRRPVSGGYVTSGPGQASFIVGDYDRSRPLVIDPVLTYATYLGGSGNDYIDGIAVDSAGNIYVTGNTWSTDFPLTNGHTFVGFADLFITKLNPTGTALMYSTHYHGDPGYYNAGHDIAVDAAGNAYVVGQGSQTGGVGGYAAVIRLNSSGVATYVGLLGYGGGDDHANGLAIDGTGYVYLTGVGGPLFDFTPGAFQTVSGGGDDAFVAKVNTNVAVEVSLVYSTFLGGGLTDEGQKIAIDSAGNAYVTGSTESPSFPVTAGGRQTTFGGGLTDAFVSKISADGSTLLYSTFLGGSFYEVGKGIAVDGSGNIYVGGWAEGSGFPTTAGSFQPAWNVGNCAVYPVLYKSCGDGFVAKINPSLAGAASLVYSTYLGGSGEDDINALLIDSAGNAWVAGKALSPQLGTTQFPTVNPITGFDYLNSDGFVAELNSTGSALLFSSYYQEMVNDVAIGPGTIYLAGDTSNTALIGTAGTYQPTNHGLQDGFIAKIGGFALPLPGAFAKGSPATGLGGQAVNQTLSWGASSGATSYEYCVNTSATCAGAWTSMGSATTAVLPTRAYRATYYWQVRARNATGTTDANAGAWWSFTTAVNGAVTDLNGDGKLDLLWRQAGTGQDVVWLMNGGAFVSTLPVLTVPEASWEIAAAADFNGDGKPDLVWRNLTTGQNVVWYMNGASYLWQAPLPAVADRAWQLVAAIDFNGDDQPDLVWHNAATGQNAVWYMSGTSLVSTAALPTVTDTLWQMVGVADFNGDGHPDLLWRHLSTGQNGIWYMNGTTKVGDAGLIPLPDLRWYVGAVGDANGDGRPDVLWHNASTGENVVWFLNGATLSSTAYLPTTTDTSWDMAGHRARPVPVRAPSDFNRDGMVDLLWRRPTTGENAVWYLNGSAYASAANLPASADTNWQLMASADLNRDGQADLIWRHKTSGANAVWYMAGPALAWSAPLPAATDANWQLAAVADFNGDGKPDLVWRHATTGQNAVWYMSGATYLSAASMMTVADTNWRIVAAADFNGDGKPDLVWRHQATGQNAIWYMDGTTKIGDALLPAVADMNWQLEMAADFNADGKTDLVWRNYSTGQNVVWLMNGTAWVSNGYLPTVVDPNWLLVRR